MPPERSFKFRLPLLGQAHESQKYHGPYMGFLRRDPKTPSIDLEILDDIQIRVKIVLLGNNSNQ